MQWILALSLVIGLAQSGTPRPQFEVASVHANKSGSGSFRSGMQNGRYETSNVPLREIVIAAFEVKDYQVSGPDWMKSERYDIQAKVPEGSSPKQLNLMIQSLLADQFKMQFHRETREMPIYALVINKGGPKLVEANDSAESAGSGSTPRQSGGGSATGAGVVISAPGGAVPSTPPELRPTMSAVGPLPSFAASLSRSMDRPVIDMTGLTGRYNIRLSYKKETDPADDPRPSIFAAVTEQLGLRLEARRGPIEVIVIDSITKLNEGR